MYDAQVAEQPATTSIIVLCTALYLRSKSEGYGDENVRAGFKRAFDTRHGTWRLPAFQLVHVHFLHLLLNMMVCWALGSVEIMVGTWHYITMSAAMSALVAFSQLAAHHAMKDIQRTCRVEPNQNEPARVLTVWAHLQEDQQVPRLFRTMWWACTGCAVGCSGVVLGWITFFVSYLSTPYLPLVEDLLIWLVPVVFMCLQHFFVPTSSFLGHCAGMLAGVLVAQGKFRVLHGYPGIVVKLPVTLCMLLGLHKEGLLSWPAGKASSRKKMEDLELSLLPTLQSVERSS